MNTQTINTQRTQGEWKANGLEIRHANRGLILANVYEHNPMNQSREEAEANAAFIVKAVNEYDQLFSLAAKLTNDIDDLKDIHEQEKFKLANSNQELLAALKSFVDAVDIIVDAKEALSEDRRKVYVSIQSSITYATAKGAIQKAEQ